MIISGGEKGRFHGGERDLTLLHDLVRRGGGGRSSGARHPPAGDGRKWEGKGREIYVFGKWEKAGERKGRGRGRRR